MADTERLRDLHQEGTLNRRLLIRVRMLSIIGAVLLAFALYSILSNGLPVLLGVVFGAVGFVLGVTVFSRMSKVVWDEEEETVSTGRMDIFGILAIVLYVAFEVGIRHFFTQVTGIHAITGYIFSAIGGSLLGRSFGTRRAIHRTLDKQREIGPVV